MRLPPRPSVRCRKEGPYAQEEEVALDTMTLDSLGLPHRTNFRRAYLAGCGGRASERSLPSAATDRENIHTESCAWIPGEAEEAAAGKPAQGEDYPGRHALCIEDLNAGGGDHCGS